MVAMRALCVENMFSYAFSEWQHTGVHYDRVNFVDYSFWSFLLDYIFFLFYVSYVFFLNNSCERKYVSVCVRKTNVIGYDSMLFLFE